MAKLVRTSNEADLRSRLGGFGNHKSRWEALNGQWPAGEKIILAYPNRVLSRNSIDWLVENVEGLSAMSSFSGEERVNIEREYAEARSALQTMLGADLLDKILPVSGIGVDTKESVWCGSKAGLSVFVVTEWGCDSAEVSPVDQKGSATLGKRRFNASIQVLDGDLPFGSSQWSIWLPELRQIEIGDDGRWDLGELSAGQKVVAQQEGLAFGEENKQFLEMGNSSTTFNLQIKRQATVVVLHPKQADRVAELNEVEARYKGELRPFNLRSDIRSEDGPFDPGERWTLGGSDGQELASLILKDGANEVDLRSYVIPVSSEDPEEIAEGEDSSADEEPLESLTRFRLENRWGSPLKEQEFTLDFGSASPRQSLITDDSGTSETLWPKGVTKATATTRVRDYDRSIEVEHEASVIQHTLRFSRRIPKWFWWSLCGVIALFFLALLPVGYNPEIRLTDAVTEEPIARATVFYDNLDGDQELSAISDSLGVVKLNMGERQLYKRVFQLNPPSPLVAMATGYKPEPSTLDVRTWYWLQDWPLSPLNEGQLAVLTLNLGTNGSPLGQVEVSARSLTRPRRAPVRVMSDANGIAILELDKRDQYEIVGEKSSFLSDSEKGPMAFLQEEPNNRLELTPILPCSGSQIQNGQQTSVKMFDMGVDNGVEFCFSCMNDWAYDAIRVEDANGNLIYELQPEDHNGQAADDFGLLSGLGRDSRDSVIWETVRIFSSTRLVAVSVEGDSHWGFSVDCPEVLCTEGRSGNPAYN